jgi:flagellar hook assembly protein FlgD
LPRGRSLAITALMLALIVGSAAAFVRTQTLKSEKPAARLLEAPARVDPGSKSPERIVVALHEPGTVTVQVVAAGEPVSVARTLATERRLPAGKSGFTWGGRGESGDPVAPGDYRVRVELTDQGRSYTFQDRMKVVRR